MYVNDKSVKSAARVLDLLEYLSGREDAVSLRDIVRDLGFPKSSAHGLLTTLVMRGYVQRNSAERYEVVPAFRERFGWVGGREAQLLTIAKPLLNDARDRTGETVFLGARRPSGDIAVIAKAVSRHPIRYDVENSEMLPGYATVMGRVMLAHWDEALLDDYFRRTTLKPFTGQTITNEHTIRALLADIRAKGFGIIEEEYALGGCGIAFPVFDASGQAVAVVDIATVAARFAGARDEIQATVRTLAATISQRLGYRPATIEIEPASEAV